MKPHIRSFTDLPFACLSYAGLLLLFLLPQPLAAQSSDPWLAGFSRIDVTPTEPVRMAGYGSRNRPSEGVDTPLYVRAMALRQPSQSTPALLISIDTIGIPGSLSRQLAETIEQKHGIPRDQLVLASTHTHAGPDLVSELSNIFAVELTEEEVAAGKRYKAQLVAGILEAAKSAIDDLSPATLGYAVGEADFAANRRLIRDGKWAGFGVQEDGPVDHSLPVLRIASPDGNVRGIIYNYACHCTTLGGDHYRINGDWAGYASIHLEAAFPEAVALCTIGCGADANPEPRGTLDATKVHGRTIATQVQRVLAGAMQSIDAPLQPRFDYAALSFNLPTREELESRKQNGDAQTKRHAEQMLKVLEERGRLPETYPVPIQSWQFGDQLTMIFLGGEVVVDYALRLKQQLDDPDLWVTAYANDVLGYIASERMIAEGGYEYDRSGIYYGLPGPWASGSEDHLISEVMKLVQEGGRSRPVDADASLKQIDLTEGYRIELVAAEPLVADPINIAFDATGRLWVVEMGDYPQGENGGRVKCLTDTDGDGRYDEVSTFLEGLAFPTGVFPWRDGVLITSAPDVLMARDTDDDGKADKVESLYTGFRLSNPQHRISGFTYGLDHSLHLSSGDNLAEITSQKTGEKVDASGHDIQIWPDSGRLAVTSGRTQYIRSRNDWGAWFGNDNSRPMYHFPIDDAYLARNPAVSYRGAVQQLFDPPVAPPVFPASEAATERYNDLFAANRFTSACSSIVARSPAFRWQDHEVAFICEPVHNLVHRAALVRDGATFRATRAENEQNREFLASRDPWFRPVRALVGPDGNLYIVDMYRETIEHPEWIPDAWQAQLDLRAGEDRGRIYRIVAEPQDPGPKAVSAMDLLPELTTAEWVQRLRSPIGPMRDLAQQVLLEQADPNAIKQLRELALDADCPHGRVHALWILQQQRALGERHLRTAITDAYPGVVINALRLVQLRLQEDTFDAWHTSVASASSHEDPQVKLQVALLCGETDDPRAASILVRLLGVAELDPWVARAVSCSSYHHAPQILQTLLEEQGTAALARLPDSLLEDLLVTTQQRGIELSDRYDRLFRDESLDLSLRIKLASVWVGASSTDQGKPALQERFQSLYQQATEQITNPKAAPDQRCQALQLIGSGLGDPDKELAMLLELLHPGSPIAVQRCAVDRLSKFPERLTASKLIERWPSMTEAIRQYSAGRLLQRTAWTQALLDALEKGQIHASELSPAVRQQLTHTGSRSMRVRAQRLTRLAGSIEKRELVMQYLSQLDGHADPTRGATLFKKHCATCHVAGDNGQAIGASLDNLTDRSTPGLLTAILDPNRAVDPKYQSYVVRTADDRILQGVIEEEAGSSVTLAHADGTRTTLSRADISDIRNHGTSLMPEGLQDVLPPEAMRDLIAFLQQRPATLSSRR